MEPWFDLLVGLFLRKSLRGGGRLPTPRHGDSKANFGPCNGVGQPHIETTAPEQHVIVKRRALGALFRAELPALRSPGRIPERPGRDPQRPGAAIGVAPPRAS